MGTRVAVFIKYTNASAQYHLVLSDDVTNDMPILSNFEEPQKKKKRKRQMRAVHSMQSIHNERWSAWYIYNRIALATRRTTCSSRRNWNPKKILHTNIRWKFYT